MEGRRLVNTFGVPEIMCTGRCLCWWEGWVWASWGLANGGSYWVKVCMRSPLESQRAAVQRCSRMTDEELSALIERAHDFKRDLRQATGWQRLGRELRDARVRERSAGAADLPGMPPPQRPRTEHAAQPYSEMGGDAGALPGAAGATEMPSAPPGLAGGAEEGAALMLPARGGVGAEMPAPPTPANDNAS